MKRLWAKFRNSRRATKAVVLVALVSLGLTVPQALPVAEVLAELAASE